MSLLKTTLYKQPESARSNFYTRIRIAVWIFFSLATVENISFAQTGSDFLRPDKVKEFKVHVSADKLQDIRERLVKATFPRQMPPLAGTDNWNSGTDIQYMKELRQYWLTKFAWTRVEEQMNSYPQYIADLDGYKVHFYYIKGEGKNPLPLIMTHGWPGSNVEFFDVIEPLTHPSKHGGKAEDSFSLIIPTLPGFGFSSMPEKPINALTTAKLWNELMTEVIGYKQYYAQGGDMGAVLSTSLAYLYPESVKAIHLNLFVWGTPIPEKEQSPAEKEWLAASVASQVANFNYLRLQMMEPLSLSVGLNDSPIGTAAWIVQKFKNWSDNDGDLDHTFSKDKIISNIMQYLLAEDGISGSFWFYRAFITEMKMHPSPGYVKVPTALAAFPKDFIDARPPLEAAKRIYNVYRYTQMPKGGHFAAMEQPQLFVNDLRDAFRQFRKK